MDWESIRRALPEFGLTRFESVLEKLVQPALRIRLRTDNNEQVVIGASKFGGLPHVPPGFSWPVWKGNLQTFLGQINFADTHRFHAAEPLPDEGLLLFFYDSDRSTWGYDPADAGSWKLIYVEVGTADLVVCAAPDSHRVLDEFPVQFTPMVSLPIPDGDGPGERLRLSDDEYDQYIEMVETLSGSEDEAFHQLLGYPDAIQGDMMLQCQLVSHGLFCGDATGYEDPRAKTLESGAKDWRLLLQFDSDDDLPCMWGDCGRLYFCIHDDALRRRAFEKSWMVLQCS